MSTRYGVLAALVAAFSVVTAVPAEATTIWTGSPSSGTNVFATMNCDAPGRVSAVTDPTMGKAWRYDKPSGDNRCESHGISVGGEKYEFRNGSTYYFGWWSKLSSTVTSNADFQWKSYGDHIQNYPVVIKTVDGRTTMIQRQPDNDVTTIWSAPIKAGTWHHYVVGLQLSDQLRGGWVKLWFDGAQQTFTGGSDTWACRTFDSSNDPKWGVYGAESTHVTNDVAGLKVGTSYDDVAARADDLARAR